MAQSALIVERSSRPVANSGTRVSTSGIAQTPNAILKHAPFFDITDTSTGEAGIISYGTSIMPGSLHAIINCTTDIELDLQIVRLRAKVDTSIDVGLCWERQLLVMFPSAERDGSSSYLQQHLLHLIAG